MQKTTLFALVVLGGMLLLANAVSAFSPISRPGPIITPPTTTPQPVVSAM